jgi:hypothetical protein
VQLHLGTLRHVTVTLCCITLCSNIIFTDVLIVGQLDVDGQSFAPIGVHKIDPSSDWLLIKRHSNGMEVLPGVQIQN